jgi:hypothetical protein
MSNRFHSKYHRKNHHTYGNPTNPDASHDPIASPDQPFLGDFSLQGALCAVAPASAYAGYFYSSKTGIRTIGGEIGLAAFSFNTPLSTAFGKNIMHGTVGINTNSITPTYVLDVLGNTNLNGNLNVTGDVDIDGGDLTASTQTFYLLNTSPTTTIHFGGNATNIEIGSNADTSTVNINGTEESTSCTTGALVVDGGVGIAKNLNICGRLDLNNTTESDSCTTGALVVDGGVGIAKNLNVCGSVTIAKDLTVLGSYTYLDTKVQVTSAMTIENTGTGPALKVTQSGTEPIAHFIDANGGDIVFNDDGFVGIGTMIPSQKLHVSDDTTTGDVRIALGKDINRLEFIRNGENDNWIRSFGGSFIIDQRNCNPIIFRTEATEKMRITCDGKVGIGGETSPEGLLHVKNGSAGTVTAQDNSVGVFENNANCYISLLSPSQNYAGVVMGGPDDSYASYLSWNHDNLDLKLATSHANADIQFLVSNEQFAMRIAPSGNVGIGITTPSEKLTVNGRVSATGFRSNQGSPSNVDSSTNGYAFGSDGDTGLFSPIIGAGGAANGVVSLFSNNVEKLRADGNAVTVFGTLSTTGSFVVNGTIKNDPNAPITKTATYQITQDDHDKTILADHATTTIDIQLPTGLKAGTQVSVIRVGAANVQFVKAITTQPDLLSTPNNDFKKLAFTNSAASAYWTGTSWYLVGDLLS